MQRHASQTGRRPAELSVAGIGLSVRRFAPGALRKGTPGRKISRALQGLKRNAMRRGNHGCGGPRCAISPKKNLRTRRS
jgi:hypothetical protein